MSEEKIKVDPSALDVSFESRDLGETLTVREFLHRLLETLWNDGEGFSGKRPFGNSGWEYDLYRALVVAGKVKGTITPDGDLDEYADNIHAYVRELIAEMCGLESEPV
jgi:hypothetical protein